MKIIKTMKTAVSENKKSGIYCIHFKQLAHLNVIVIAQLPEHQRGMCIPQSTAVNASSC